MAAHADTTPTDNGPTGTVQRLCRDCLAIEGVAPLEGEVSGTNRPACQYCGGPRTIAHPELGRLSIAHIDCDAFYASIEKRDNPDLTDHPVIIGGARRGVVAAACYISRIYGVRSAMPMFQALERCPDAIVIPPNMEKYRAAGREVRAMMMETTPMIESISIDEAFLDLSGTERLHHGPPAQTLARLVLEIERKIGITVSIGLSYNKFLAKIASDLDKPRGFAVIGEAEAQSFLKDKPVGIIWGVGKTLRAKLARNGVETVGDLMRYDLFELTAQYGAMGKRLYHFARGEDHRSVDPVGETKSISGETTFNEDLSRAEDLKRILWPLCEKVSTRLKKAGFAGRTVTLKLKTADFKTITRARTLSNPTQLAETLYRTASPVIDKEADGRRFRLIGVGASELCDPADADPTDLGDPGAAKRAKVERTIDDLRAKLGDGALTKGRGWKPD